MLWRMPSLQTHLARMKQQGYPFARFLNVLEREIQKQRVEHQEGLMHVLSERLWRKRHNDQVDDRDARVNPALWSDFDCRKLFDRAEWS